MRPPLNVRNAQVSTATVEIKTLTVSGKQVTLTVFRQLIEAPLIVDDGSLNGEAWGTVNYHRGKCDDDAPHWHVVWQQGDELRRSQVSMTYEPPPVFWSKSLAHLHAASVHQWLAIPGKPGMAREHLRFFKVDADSSLAAGCTITVRSSSPARRGSMPGYQVPEEVRAALLAESGFA